MKLVILSHKLCWRLADGTVATNGGFPFQMRTLAELFSCTDLLVPVAAQKDENGIAPPGLTPLSGRRLEVVPLIPLPPGGWRRRRALLALLLRHGRTIWLALSEADAVHIPLPSDVGLIGLLLALLRRKRLLVRHCGTWGARRSATDHLLAFLLPRIAGNRTVVLATGGGPIPPAPRHPAIEWIFATTLTAADLDRPAAPAWQPGDAPRLISVGRLERGKNVAAAIDALEILRQRFPAATLRVVGDGPERPRLERQATDLGLENAVTFCGNLTHDGVLEQLSESHLLVFPTRVAEGFPKAVVEALALGVPVIAPPVSVIPDLIRDCGVILRDTSGEAVASAILDVLAAPDDLAAMARAAQQRAQSYTLESWREQIADLLRRRWRVPTLDETPEVM